MNKTGIGNSGEDIAVKYLSEHGVKILDRNFHTKHGEIDIVGLDGEYLVFFEVKFRKNLNYGDPLTAIIYSKQKNILNASRVYMYLKGYPEDAFVRFDCIGITGSCINWIKNAF